MSDKVKISETLNVLGRFQPGSTLARAMQMDGVIKLTSYIYAYSFGLIKSGMKLRADLVYLDGR